jgi:membrane-bound inhibitor of C-type lysozyme
MRVAMHRWMASAAAVGLSTAVASSALAQTVVNYRCKDGSEVPVAFFQGDKRAHLQIDGKAMSLPRRISVTGTRYSRAGVTLRIKGNGATIRRGGRTTECTAE